MQERCDVQRAHTGELPVQHALHMHQAGVIAGGAHFGAGVQYCANLLR
jgi:hypothetical protein